MTPGPRLRPLARDIVVERLADRLAADHSPFVRVAIDGPPCAAPEALADELVEPLRLRGRPAVHLRADAFWRDASLRLEYGHEDLESFRDWLDVDSLVREVLAPLAAEGRYLPSLRDPVTNRSTREPVRTAEPGTVLLLSGALLLGRDLPLEHRVHLAMSPAARARRTAPEDAWTLLAYDDYDRDVRPAERADVTIKLDDPKHPAVAGL